MITRQDLEDDIRWNERELKRYQDHLDPVARTTSTSMARIMADFYAEQLERLRTRLHEFLKGTP